MQRPKTTGGLNINNLRDKNQAERKKKLSKRGDNVMQNSFSKTFNYDRPIAAMRVREPPKKAFT